MPRRLRIKHKIFLSKNRRINPGRETPFVVEIHLQKFTKKNQQDTTVYQNFISYLYKTQHVSGDTPPIIRNLKLHYQPLVLHK